MNNIPQSLDSERALLGGLIVDEDARLELLYKIKSDDFYLNRHKLIFDAIKSLWNNNNNIDVIEIANELGNKLAECGGKSYLLELTDDMLAILNPIQKFDTIREKARLRKLLSLGMHIMQMASSEDSSDRIIEHIDKEVFELLEDQTSGERHVSEIADDALEMIEKIQKEGKPQATSTGHERLDQMMLGWEKAKLYFLGGRSGVGKTGFAIDLIKKTSRNSYVCDFFL